MFSYSSGFFGIYLASKNSFFNEIFLLKFWSSNKGYRKFKSSEIFSLFLLLIQRRISLYFFSSNVNLLIIPLRSEISSLQLLLSIKLGSFIFKSSFISFNCFLESFITFFFFLHVPSFFGDCLKPFGHFLPLSSRTGDIFSFSSFCISSNLGIFAKGCTIVFPCSTGPSLFKE